MICSARESRFGDCERKEIMMMTIFPFATIIPKFSSENNIYFKGANTMKQTSIDKISKNCLISSAVSLLTFLQGVSLCPPLSPLTQCHLTVICHSRGVKLSLSSICTHFNTLTKIALENGVERGEFAHFEQFHLFPQCLLCNLYHKML